MSKRGKKFKRQVIGVRPQQVTATPEVLPAADLRYVNAATVKPDYKQVQIVVAGCGGTGAYLIQSIGRMMRVLYENGKGAHLTIVDPDIVEERNIGRQLFCPAEIGEPKAEAIARRIGHAWGLNISSYVGNYSDSLLLDSELTVLVGCVDNAGARSALADSLNRNEGLERPNTWWMDSGNVNNSGRVLFGSSMFVEDLEGAFPDKKTCLRLPAPSLQYPGLLEPRPEELTGGNMSCAEMLLAGQQSLNINNRLAAEAADFLTRFLLTEDLKRFNCSVNLAAGQMSSMYITPEDVAKSIHRSPDFLTQAIPSVALRAAVA